MGEKIRIFFGSEPKTEIPRKVLQYSIARRTSAEVEFTTMLGPDWEYDISGISVGTGFSLRRWMIPAACDFKGRAIYLDADQLVFSDIFDLWNYPDRLPRDGASVWCTYQQDKYNAKAWPQTSVMVVDCKAARDEWGWKIGEVLAYLKKAGTKAAYADFMHCVAPKDGLRQWWTNAQPVQVATEWNHLNVFKAGETKLLHYTKEPEQVWYNPTHPYAHEWKKELICTINAGLISKEEFEQALAKWNKQEDWRSMNGLHPDYASFLPLFNKTGARKKRMAQHYNKGK